MKKEDGIIISLNGDMKFISTLKENGMFSSKIIIESEDIIDGGTVVVDYADVSPREIFQAISSVLPLKKERNILNEHIFMGTIKDQVSSDTRMYLICEANQDKALEVLDRKRWFGTISTIEYEVDSYVKDQMKHRLGETKVAEIFPKWDNQAVPISKQIGNYINKIYYAEQKKGLELQKTQEIKVIRPYFNREEEREM